MAKRKTKPVDHDLETWIRLGGGVTEAESDAMSEGQRIMEAGNQWVREQLQPSTPLRASAFAVNPFRRGL
jgi:hypothetical protein